MFIKHTFVTLFGLVLFTSFQQKPLKNSINYTVEQFAFNI